MWKLVDRVARHDSRDTLHRGATNNVKQLT